MKQSLKMNPQLQLVKEFHEKFNVPIATTPQCIAKNRYEFRYKFIKEEVEEYIKGNEQQDLENIAKELCDIISVVYGAVLEHGLQDKFDLIFEEIHKSNMSKEKGEFKLIKGDNFKEANISKILKE